MHIATTPLVIMPASEKKTVPRHADKGAADPLIRPTQGVGPSSPPSTRHSSKKTTAQRGRGGRPGATQRPTTGELRPKDIVVRLFADPIVDAR